MKLLPKSVKIGAFDYCIEYNSRISEEGLCGKIQLLHNKIELRPEMSPDAERLILLHEVFHGFLFLAGIKEHEERVLDVLAHGVIQLAQTNPEILK